MALIYHIVERKSWEDQKEASNYIHNSLEVEGFIHASHAAQIDGVLDRYYVGIQHLLLLTIDDKLLESSSPMKEEMASSVGEMFPHIYGPINKSAIIEVEVLR